MIRLVAAWATVGPVGEPVGESHPLLQQLVVGDDAVDDVPTLEGRRVVEPPTHHELRGAGGAGAFGHSLRAPSARGEPDHRLDQAEPVSTRSAQSMSQASEISRPCFVGQAEAMDERQGRTRSSSSLRAVAISGAPKDAGRGALLDGALKPVDVSAAGEELALGPPDERPGVGGLQPRRSIDQRALRRPPPNRFRGGLSSTITARLPSRSSRTGADF